MKKLKVLTLIVILLMTTGVRVFANSFKNENSNKEELMTKKNISINNDTNYYQQMKNISFYINKSTTDTDLKKYFHSDTYMERVMAGILYYKFKKKEYPKIFPIADSDVINFFKNYTNEIKRLCKIEHSHQTMYLSIVYASFLNIFGKEYFNYIKNIFDVDTSGFTDENTFYKVKFRKEILKFIFKIPDNDIKNFIYELRKDKKQHIFIREFAKRVFEEEMKNNEKKDN